MVLRNSKLKIFVVFGCLFQSYTSYPIDNDIIESSISPRLSFSYDALNATESPVVFNLSSGFAIPFRIVVEDFNENQNKVKRRGKKRKILRFRVKSSSNSTSFPTSVGDENIITERVITTTNKETEYKETASTMFDDSQVTTEITTATATESPSNNALTNIENRFPYLTTSSNENVTEVISTTEAIYDITSTYLPTEEVITSTEITTTEAITTEETTITTLNDMYDTTESDSANETTINDVTTDRPEMTTTEATSTESDEITTVTDELNTTDSTNNTDSNITTTENETEMDMTDQTNEPSTTERSIVEDTTVTETESSNVWTEAIPDTTIIDS